MQNSKSYPRMFMAVLIAFLSIVFLGGCHGSLGWDRMDGPLGRQSQSGFHQPR
jgi:hypothetical protein